MNIQRYYFSLLNHWLWFGERTRSCTGQDLVLNLVLRTMASTHSTAEYSTAWEGCSRKCRGLCKWSGLAAFSAMPGAAANIVSSTVPHAFRAWSHSLLTVALCTLSIPVLQVKKLRLRKSHSPRIPEQRWYSQNSDSGGWTRVWGPKCSISS